MPDATLAEALHATGRFPERLLHAVAVGQATGNTAEALDRLAEEFDDESRRGFEVAARGAGGPGFWSRPRWPA